MGTNFLPYLLPRESFHRQLRGWQSKFAYCYVQIYLHPTIGLFCSLLALPWFAHGTLTLLGTWSAQALSKFQGRPKFVVGQGLEVVESSGWFADLAWHVNLSQQSKFQVYVNLSPSRTQLLPVGCLKVVLQTILMPKAFHR